MQHIHSHTSPTHKHTQRTRTKHLLLLLLLLSCVMYIVFCPPLLLSLLTLLLLLFSRLLCCVHVSRLSFLVLVWCLVVVGAFAHLHVHQLTFLSSVCPLCRVLCHSHIIKVIISSLSPTSAAAAANCARSCSLPLSPFYSFSLSISLCCSVWLATSAIGQGHRVRFVISASNKTHPFANTRCTLDNRHPRYPLDMGQGHAVQQ